LIVAELFDDFAAVFERGIAGEVDKAPIFGLADSADDLGKQAELDVDHDLGYVS
jgi:hypothetical protein